MTPDRKPVVLVTGASRGLGFELVRQYAAEGCEVIAACRDPRSPAFPPEVRAETLDASDAASIAGLAARLGGETIDILINNAAIRGDTGGLATLEPDGFMEVMRVNALGPLLLVKALQPNLRRSARPIVANISSRVGTVAGIDPDGDYAYCCSKAALNMATAKLAMDHDVAFVALHPGWLKTGMGGEGAEVDVTVSALGLRRAIEKSRPPGTASFVNYTGEALPW